MMKIDERYVAMSFPEIAKRLGTSTDAVEQSYRRAINKLRRQPRTLRPIVQLAMLMAELREQRN
jgi:DNA-directed RNA polymerase specialized sigma24 family protein